MNKYEKTVKVAPIVEKMRENCLRWFGHVQRRILSAPVRKCDDISLNQVRGNLALDRVKKDGHRQY